MTKLFEERIRILANVGLDATADDCRLFVEINQFTKVTDSELDGIREFLKEQDRDFPTKEERTHQMLCHLLRNEYGRKAAATILAESPDGLQLMQEQLNAVTGKSRQTASPKKKVVKRRQPIDKVEKKVPTSLQKKKSRNSK